MQCWNIRELIKGNKKKGNINDGLIYDYLIIKELFSGLETKNFDYFIAGYMAGNNLKLKEELLKIRRRNENEKIRNNC